MLQLTQQYADWLSEKTATFELSSGWTEVVTPFLNFNNDRIEFYLKLEEDGSISFSDDGQTLRELTMAGFTHSSKKRQAMVNGIVKSFGLSLADGELQASAQPATFPKIKHRFVQAMQQLLDLHVLAKSNVAKFFQEDVELLLLEKELAYTTDATFYGYSGYEHQFPFSLGRTKHYPETLIATLTNPRKNLAQGVLFSLEDTLKVKREAKALIIVDDEGGIPGELKQAVNKYNYPLLGWSEREVLSREYLAAGLAA